MSTDKLEMSDAVEQLCEGMSSLGQPNQSSQLPQPSQLPPHSQLPQSSQSGDSQSFFSLDNSSSRPKSPSPNKDEEMVKWLAGQVKGLQTAISVPLLQVVRTFEGDPSKFKQWIKDIERYAQMARLDDNDIPRIVLMTCSGSIADFVKRYLDEVAKKGDPPIWPHLKKLMQKRFAEITDPQQAMAVLRRIRQKPDESVQLYSERLLRIAEDAYPTPYDERDHHLVQKQLIDIFCDGLCFDYLRMKVLRENPDSFEKALEIAMREQNLRKRFNLRSDAEYASMLAGTNPNMIQSPSFGMGCSQSNPQQNFQNLNFPTVWQSDLQNVQNALNNQNPRVVEPMEIDYFRNQKCFKCNGTGHRARECPTPGQMYSKQKHWLKAVDSSDDDSDESDENEVVSPQKAKKTPKTKKAPKKTEKPPPKPQPKKTTPAPRQNRAPKQNPAQRIAPEIPEWIKGAECWICHMIGHLKVEHPSGLRC